jgi:integrase
MRWSPGSAARFDGVHKNYVGPHWNSWHFDRIDRRAVLGWVADLQAADIGPATVTKALAVFRAVWAEARRDEIAGQDPSAGLTVRKPPHVMGRSLNEDELTRLVTAADDPPLRTQLLLTGVVGLRWGEMAGLNCGDVDLDECLIHIRASLARGDAGYEVKAPKTTSSARAVPIPDVMAGLLRTVVDGRPGGSLFVSPANRRLNYHTSRRRLIRTADAAAILDCTGWHVLRRTAGTLALRAGLNLRDVQKLLGHQSPSLTLSAYVAARETLALVGPLNKLATSALGR